MTFLFYHCHSFVKLSVYFQIRFYKLHSGNKVFLDEYNVRKKKDDLLFQNLN